MSSAGLHRRGLSLGLLLGLALPGSLPIRAHGPVHVEIAQLTTELERHPKDPALLLRRGELWRVDGLFAEARRDWEALAAQRPDDVTNHLRLGWLALDVRETNAALGELKQFVQARPRCLEGQLAIAEASTLAEDFSSAVEHWSVAIDLSPEPRPEWYLSRAKAAQAAGAAPEMVLSGLDAGIRRYGPLPALTLLAIDVELQRKEVDSALRRLDALAARAERKERWWVKRADILQQAGRTNDARAALIAAEQALAALPEKQQRAWLASELKREIATKLEELSPPSSPAHSPPAP